MCDRCKDTFSNYLGYLRVGCLIDEVTTVAFDDPAVKRSRSSIKKRRNFKKRPKLFVRRPVIHKIMQSCLVNESFEENYGTLYLITYVFLLRVPSEALPIVRGGNGVADYGLSKNRQWFTLKVWVCDVLAVA